jgi:hypothetical protein
MLSEASRQKYHATHDYPYDQVIDNGGDERYRNTSRTLCPIGKHEKDLQEFIVKPEYRKAADCQQTLLAWKQLPAMVS